MFRRSISAAIMAAMLAFAGFSPAASAAPRVGHAAPVLIVKTLDGKVFSLSAQKGKVVLINFWATWCTPCREEMPVLNSFYLKYHRKGLVLLGLSDDSPHDLDTVRAVMKKMSYPAALLPDSTENDLGTPLSLPVTYVIDRKGILRAIKAESLSKKELAETVLPLLKGRGHEKDEKQ